MNQIVFFFLTFSLAFSAFSEKNKSTTVTEAKNILRNAQSAGNETLAEYIQRNESILPKKYLDAIKKSPGMKNKIGTIEIVPGDSRTDIYLKDEDGKQFTMTISNSNKETELKILFDGVSLTMREFVNQNHMHQKIIARNYTLRQKFETEDPHSWLKAFQSIKLQSIETTMSKEGIINYNRALVFLYVQSQKVNRIKKEKKFSRFRLLFSDALADDKNSSCIERGYLGALENLGCRINSNDLCEDTKQKPCNPQLFGYSDGKNICIPAADGTAACAKYLEQDSPLFGMDVQVFSQPSLHASMKESLRDADRISAEKFVLSYLKKGPKIDFTEINEIQKAFEKEINSALLICQTEFKKKQVDSAVKKECLHLKKQQILFEAGFDKINLRNKKLTGKSESCENSSAASCDSPEAAGASSCYSGIFICNKTNLLIAGGVAAVAGLAMMNSKNNEQQPPGGNFDPCDGYNGMPGYFCKDPAKCRAPFDFSTVYNVCKPPKCPIGQDYSSHAKGCTSSCELRNQQLTMLLPLNCNNQAACDEKIWNPYTNKCEEPAPCVNGQVRDPFNFCMYERCDPGHELNYTNGQCIPADQFKTCEVSGHKVMDLRQCPPAVQPGAR